MEIKALLDSCSRIEYLVLNYRLYNYNTTSDLTGVELFALTHLELTFDNTDGMALMPQVIRRCPHLLSLFIDTVAFKDYVPKGHLRKYCRTCIERAYKHRPQLKTIEIGTGWRTSSDPKKVFILDHSKDACRLADEHGLHTLKYSYWWNYRDLRLILEKSYQSLEILYLSYQFYRVERINLLPLRMLYAAPNLRCVAFSLTQCTRKPGPPPSTYLQDIITFFSTTPTLEEIAIEFGFWGSKSKLTSHYESDYEPEVMCKAGDVLLTITRNCCLLRALTLNGDHPYPEHPLFEFAEAVVSNLTHLKGPTMRDHSSAIELVKRIPTLIHFTFSEVHYHGYGRYKSEREYRQELLAYTKTIEHILKERTESLCV
ncbi:hypothetical protein BJV82DRAFT_663684 [Fennellomyces sp. T-0311]|nr:hypothetical protein BJV82DRAFT_663684 [Fennellomyces sp. T-0311]